LIVRSDVFKEEMPNDERIVYDAAVFERKKDLSKPYSKYVEICCDKEEWLLE
jgi:hypothetical protein